MQIKLNERCLGYPSDMHVGHLNLMDCVEEDDYNQLFGFLEAGDGSYAMTVRMLGGVCVSTHGWFQTTQCAGDADDRIFRISPGARAVHCVAHLWPAPLADCCYGGMHSHGT